MKNLKEAINKREPIKVYIKAPQDIEWTDLGVYEYNEEKSRYEGAKGHLSLENISKWMIGNKSLDHIKLEVINESSIK